MIDRTIRFNPRLGDRVARKPGAKSGRVEDAAKTWDEAILYASERARKTGLRQTLLRGTNRYGWWLCYAERKKS